MQYEYECLYILGVCADPIKEDSSGCFMPLQLETYISLKLCKMNLSMAKGKFTRKDVRGERETVLSKLQ